MIKTFKHPLTVKTCNLPLIPLFKTSAWDCSLNQSQAVVLNRGIKGRLHAFTVKGSLAVDIGPHVCIPCSIHSLLFFLNHHHGPNQLPIDSYQIGCAYEKNEFYY